MTNDERNPKPECRRDLWCAVARSSFGFRYSFGFRHSSFGFENRGSWRVFQGCGQREALMDVLLARAVSTPPASTGAASEHDRERKHPGCGKRFHREIDCLPAARRFHPPGGPEISPGPAQA